MDKKLFAIGLGLMLFLGSLIGGWLTSATGFGVAAKSVERGVARVVLYGECDADDNDVIIRSYNNVNSKPITIRPSSDDNPHSCIINIGSNAQKRFIVATWENSHCDSCPGFFVGVSAREADPNEIRVTIFNAAGEMTNGFFYLTVY